MRTSMCAVVTGPSGVGKNTLIEALVATIPDSVRLVTTTTREPRDGEVNGVDYYFVTRKEFLASVEKGKFLEYEENYGNLYGTSKLVLEDLLSRYKVVFVGGIDTRGARSIKKALPEAVTIFVLPDSLESLRTRLERRRGKDDIEKRLSQASDKISQAGDFDHRVINKEGLLHEAIKEVRVLLETHLSTG